MSVTVCAPFVVRAIKKDVAQKWAVRARPMDLVVRVEGEAEPDDWLTLRSADGKYAQHQSAHGGEVVFTGLDPEQKFTLEIATASGDKRVLFEDVPYVELSGLRPAPAPQKDPGKGDLLVRIDIDPADAREAADEFRLWSAEGYEQRKTIKDDQKPGDKSVDLHFTDLPRGHSFSLEISGNVVFADIPYAELALLSGDDGGPDLREDLIVDQNSAVPAAALT